MQRSITWYTVDVCPTGDSIFVCSKTANAIKVHSHTRESRDKISTRHVHVQKVKKATIRATVLKQLFYLAVRECLQKFGEGLGEEVWEATNVVFDVMPIAATIDKKVSERERERGECV